LGIISSAPSAGIVGRHADKALAECAGGTKIPRLEKRTQVGTASVLAPEKVHAPT
jgi:hypothetical protein